MSKAEPDRGSAVHVAAVSASGPRGIHDLEAEVPIELGDVVTARLGGKAAAARIMRGWTRKVTPPGSLSAVDVCMCLGCLGLIYRAGLPLRHYTVACNSLLQHCLLMPARRRSRATDGWSTLQPATAPTLSCTYSGRCRIERACCSE